MPDDRFVSGLLPLAQDEPLQTPLAQGLMPLPQSGLTNKFVNPSHPFTQALGDIIGRYADYYKTPGNMLQGNYSNIVQPEVPGQWSDRDEARAAGTAGELQRRGLVMGLDAMTGGFPFAQKGAVGIFGGRLAATADKAALARAEEMAAKGVAPDKIWQETGWSLKPEMFEISDHAAVMLPDRAKTMGEKFIHPDLYKAFNDLSEIPVRYRERMDNAYYQPPDFGRKEHIGMPRTEAYREPPEHKANLQNNKSLALHELQHAVAERTGLPKGTSPEAMMPDATREIASRQSALSPKELSRFESLKAKRDLTTSETEEFMELTSKKNFVPIDQIKKLAFEKYWNDEGERLARQVQERMDWTPEMRRANPPTLSEDVPRELQTIVGARK